MKVTELWVVRDPTKSSTFEDCCFVYKDNPAFQFNLYSRGCINSDVVGRENTTLYCGSDAEAEARADAFERMRALRPVRTFTVFGTYRGSRETGYCKVQARDAREAAELTEFGYAHSQVVEVVDGELLITHIQPR